MPNGKRVHLGLPMGTSVGVVGRGKDRSTFVYFLASNFGVAQVYCTS